MMRVHLPSPLHSYTGGRPTLQGQGGTVREVLLDLDRQCPGLSFRLVDEQERIRPTILFYLNRQIVRDLSAPVHPSDEIHIVAALSGG
jgi:molybdopterin converting factor small subunit